MHNWYESCHISRWLYRYPRWLGAQLGPCNLRYRTRNKLECNLIFPSLCICFLLLCVKCLFVPFVCSFHCTFVCVEKGALRLEFNKWRNYTKSCYVCETAQSFTTVKKYSEGFKIDTPARDPVHPHPTWRRRCAVRQIISSWHSRTTALWVGSYHQCRYHQPKWRTLRSVGTNNPVFDEFTS